MSKTKSKIVNFEQGAAHVRSMQNNDFDALALKAGFVKLSDIEFDLVYIYTRFMSAGGLKRLSLYIKALQKDFPVQLIDESGKSSASLTKALGGIEGLSKGRDLNQIALIALNKGYTKLSNEEAELIMLRVRALSSEGVERLMLLVEVLFPELCQTSQSCGL